VYVDDLLVTGTSQACVDGFFELISGLDVKNLGVVSKFLGICFETNEGQMVLDQHLLIEEVLKKFNMQEANPITLPIADGYELVSEKDEVLLPSRATPDQAVGVQDFQSLVGSLLWIARCTRPAILFAVHAATRKAHAPRLHDLKICRKYFVISREQKI
jgi:hypothetical protein